MKRAKRKCEQSALGRTLALDLNEMKCLMRMSNQEDDEEKTDFSIWIFNANTVFSSVFIQLQCHFTSCIFTCTYTNFYVGPFFYCFLFFSALHLINLVVCVCGIVWCYSIWVFQQRLFPFFISPSAEHGYLQLKVTAKRQTFHSQF